MRSAAQIRLALKVYAYVFLASLVYLNAMQGFVDFMSLRWSTDDTSISYMVDFHIRCAAVAVVSVTFFILAFHEILRHIDCGTVIIYYKNISWMVFVVVAEWMWRFLARLLVSWWQLLVDVFDVDRWWDAASQGTVFFGSFFAYCLFTVALRSIELEDIEDRERALRAHQDRRDMEAEDTHA